MKHAFDEGFYFGVAVDKAQIRPHLIGGIAQPHGVDVAGNDKRIGTTLFILRGCHGGIERVGKTVGKKPRQFRVAQRLAHFGNRVFDDGAGKTAFFQRRALTGECDRVVFCHREKCNLFRTTQQQRVFIAAYQSLLCGRVFH